MNFVLFTVISLQLPSSFDRRVGLTHPIAESDLSSFHNRRLLPIRQLKATSTFHQRELDSTVLGVSMFLGHLSGITFRVQSIDSEWDLRLNRALNPVASSLRNLVL